VLAVNTPSAGESRTVTICDSSSSINLFTILLGPYDTNGVWEEISNSNALNGNIWSPFNLPLGTYIFKYTVNGSCGNFDEAFITIDLDNGPPIPILNGNSYVCEGDDIIISVDNILNNNITYLWSGPNNFTSTNPNVLISNSDPMNSGTYSVTAFLNDCQETTLIDINVLSIPEFKIEYKCINNEFILEVMPVNDSVISDISLFNWYGPNGFSSLNNPVVLTNFSTGTYGVNLINNQNCRSTLEIELSSTLCSIPNVITPNSDGSNDSFDLTGLLVDNIEIYNRWGRLVYNKSNYIDEWIGQNNEGKLLPDSTYFYLLKLKSGEVKSGWVLIVTK
jgi:gliding motility-associated-like protein